MRALAPCLSLRTLFGMLIALAVLSAPAIGRGEALAAVPNHDMQMMKAGRCQEPASHGAGHNQGDMSCCTALYVGITATVDEPAAEAVILALPASFMLAALHRPFLDELATPPPRFA